MKCIQGRQLFDLKQLKYQSVNSLLHRVVKMAGEASEEGVVESLDDGILEVHSLTHHLEGPTEVSQANIASFILSENFRPGSQVELQNQPLLPLVEHGGRSITIDYWPQVCL